MPAERNFLPVSLAQVGIQVRLHAKMPKIGNPTADKRPYTPKRQKQPTTQQSPQNKRLRRNSQPPNILPKTKGCKETIRQSDISSQPLSYLEYSLISVFRPFSWSRSCARHRRSTHRHHVPEPASVTYRSMWRRRCRGTRQQLREWR